LAFELQQEIFEASKLVPLEERYALTDQIRRASRSVGANVSEAWQKRRYVAHFISKLTDADGELAESQHWLVTAAACNYLSKEKAESLVNKCRRIGQMLGYMMANSEKWHLATVDIESQGKSESSNNRAEECVDRPSSVVSRRK
jgi:four helix bundle protein